MGKKLTIYHLNHRHCREWERVFYGWSSSFLLPFCTNSTSKVGKETSSYKASKHAKSMNVALNDMLIPTDTVIN